MTPSPLAVHPIHSTTSIIGAAAPAADCERRATTPPATVVRLARSPWGLAIGALALATALVGCGGKKGDAYAKAVSKQEACCGKLDGSGRDECNAAIVRVGDPAVAQNAVNQATFDCVERNFECDPGTGHATQPSAQEQLMCIQALGQ